MQDTALQDITPELRLTLWALIIVSAGKVHRKMFNI